MPSAFPELYNYSQFAPLFLRIVLAVVLFLAGSLFAEFIPEKYKKIEDGARIILGLLLLLGLFIQPAALVIFLSFLALALRPLKKERRKEILLIMAVALSLIFLGPGLFAIDLPL